MLRTNGGGYLLLFALPGGRWTAVTPKECLPHGLSFILLKGCVVGFHHGTPPLLQFQRQVCGRVWFGLPGKQRFNAFLSCFLRVQ